MGSENQTEEKKSSSLFDTAEKKVSILTIDPEEANNNQREDEGTKEDEDILELDFQYIKKEKARCVIELKTFIFVIE